MNLHEYAFAYAILRMLMQRLFSLIQDHPNAVKLHEVYNDTHNFYIVMECCDGGELFEHISKKTVSYHKTLDENNIY